MDFTKRDLRNGSNALLRRVQRQEDKKCWKEECVFEELKKSKKKEFAFGFESETFEEPELLPVKKQTRLKLFGNKVGKR